MPLNGFIVTNKAAKGSLVAMVKGTQVSSVIEVLRKIAKRIRGKVRGVTLDMAASMGLIVSRCFPKASKVIDRFHVQKLAFDAVQWRYIKTAAGQKQVLTF
jgi:transposase